MKFKVGEIVILVESLVPIYNGTEVEIKKVGPGLPVDKTGEIGVKDYYVTTPDGKEWGADEQYLRKRRPPEEPADEEFQEDLRDWLKKPVVETL